MPWAGVAVPLGHDMDTNIDLRIGMVSKRLFGPPKVSGIWPFGKGCVFNIADHKYLIAKNQRRALPRNSVIGPTHCDYERIFKRVTIR